MMSFSSCYLLKIVKWGGATMKDYEKFSYKTINKSQNYFKFYSGKQINPGDVRIPKIFFQFNGLEDLLVKTNTLSFLICLLILLSCIL